MPRILVFAAFSLLLVLPTFVQAQEAACTPAHEFVYDAAAETLSLVHRASGAVSNVLTDVLDFDRRASSPDCRFLVGAVWRFVNNRFSNYRAGDTTVFNAATGAVLAEYPQPSNSTPHPILWSPDSQRLLVSTRNGSFLWDFLAGSISLVTTQSVVIYRQQHYWDEERHELFLMGQSDYQSAQEVIVVNWLSGEVVGRYHNAVDGLAEAPLFHRFRVYPDVLIVYSVAARGDYPSDGNPATIWDRSSGQLLAQVNMEAAAVPTNRGSSALLIDLSPDRRYVAIGFRTLRVWDLWNLPANFEERTRTYQYLIDDYGVNALHFVDNTTVEVLLDDGFTRWRYDVTTGRIE